MKLEVLVLPVADVDRARAFYEALGFRLDIDYAASEDVRVAQLTPPGSEACGRRVPTTPAPRAASRPGPGAPRLRLVRLVQRTPGAPRGRPAGSRTLTES